MYEETLITTVKLSVLSHFSCCTPWIFRYFSQLCCSNKYVNLLGRKICIFCGEGYFSSQILWGTLLFLVYSVGNASFPRIFCGKHYFSSYILWGTLLFLVYSVWNATFPRIFCGERYFSSQIFNKTNKTLIVLHV